jgi:hypothetical protein
MKLDERIHVLEARIDCLLNKINENYTKQYGYNDLVFDVVKGTKYYKIIQRSIKRTNLGGDGGFVHAFIHRQSGAVYKPASWKAPAKHVRYNLLDDVSYETCLHNADWAGSYLYMK